MVAQSVEAYAEIRARIMVEMRGKRSAAPDNWRDWIAAIFPGHLRPPYAAYHESFWEWAWSIQPDQAQSSFVAIWPRGFAKSTSTEVACALMAGEGKRKYGLYVCATQERADDHVQSVAGMLESPSFGRFYPQASQRKVGKFGNSKGWRRNRLRTSSGFTLDAIGLDSAARGAKVDEDRPDFIIFDDVDGVLDSPGTTQKKITLITQSIIPARAPYAVVLVAQNLITENGVVARIADGRADFLSDRIVSGPHPALTNMATAMVDGKQTIIAGESTWPAMTREMLQVELNDIGLTAFMREKQHEVGNIEGGIFGHVQFVHHDIVTHPLVFDEVVVWVDPAVTDTDQSDAHGVQVAGRIGRAKDGMIYMLYSWEKRASPEQSLRLAILKAIEYKATSVGVETDQGGDTWKSVYTQAWNDLLDSGQIPLNTRKPTFKQDKAGSIGPKAHRANQMLADYETGKIVHVIAAYPTHGVLERGLRRYLMVKPYDLVDACLVAGTLIETINGAVPIECIKAGDMVMTRRGLKPVIDAGKTQTNARTVTATFSDGRTITGTPNHRIFTQEHGWKQLGEIAGNHAIILPWTIPSIQSNWNTTGAFTDGIQTHRNERTASTMSLPASVLARLTTCIAKCGSTAMARYRKGTKSTTRTETRSTTMPTTSSVSRSKSTETSIEKLVMAIHRKVKRISTAFGILPLNGIQHRTASNGTVNTLDAHGKTPSLNPQSVPCAERRSRHDHPSGLCIARNDAGAVASTKTNDSLSTSPAKNADSSSAHQSIEHEEYAVLRAVRVSMGENADVYNLSVADQPEYYANGVLVHNCYWAWHDLRTPPRTGRVSNG